MIHVEIIKSQKAALRPFIQLPFDIYRHDPNWVAPRRHDLTRCLMGINNDFFARGIQRLFLAYDDEKPVARVLAGIDLRQTARLGDGAGYISLFESYDNYDYAVAVLDAAARFLREHGAKEVFGPVAPRYDLLNRGMLVEGFDGPPVLENAYNSPALPDMLEKYGFTKWRDYYAYLIRIDQIPLDKIFPMSNRIRQRFGFRVEQVDFARGNLIRVAQDLSTIICEATPEEPGSYLPAPEDLLELFKRIKPWLKSETALIAYAGQRPIGCVIGFLDSAPALIHTSGRRTPNNWLRRVVRTPHIRSSRCPIQYVVPEYQNKAVNAVLMAEAVKGAKSLGVDTVEGSLVDETHILSINNTQTAGGKLYRSYRVYRMGLESSA